MMIIQRLFPGTFRIKRGFVHHEWISQPGSGLVLISATGPFSVNQKMASSSLALGFMPWLAFKHDGKEFPSINTSFDLNGYLLKEDVYSYQPTSLGVRARLTQAIQWTAETLEEVSQGCLMGGILW